METGDVEGDQIERVVVVSMILLHETQREAGRMRVMKEKVGSRYETSAGRWG